MTPALYAAAEEAVQVITPDGRRLEAGRAVLYVLAAIGCRRLAALGQAWPFIWAIEWGYWLVARHRSWFSGWLRP